MKKFGTIGKKNIQWNLAKKVGTKDSIITNEQRARAKRIAEQNKKKQTLK